MTNKRITDVDFIESLNSDESFFVNQNNTIKQINKGDITFDIVNGGTGANNAEDARENLDAAPTSHASAGTTYGKGTNNNYGHVKLSDSTSSTSGVDSGIAATPYAVKTVYDNVASLSGNILNVASPIEILEGTQNISSNQGLETITDFFVAPENGLYFINAYVQWDVASTGFCSARLSTCTGGSLIPASGCGIQHVLTDSVYLTKDQAVRLLLRQTSGSDLECVCSGRFSYIPL